MQPELKMPTLISYSLRVEQELTPNTSLTVGYVGSHGYHEIVGIDANTPFPTICPASPCPAIYPTTFPAGLAGTPVPAGSFYIPAGTPKANPTTRQYLDLVLRRRQQLQRAASGSEPSLQPRSFASRRVHLVEGAGRWRFAERHHRGECAGLVSNPYNMRADWGLGHLRRAQYRRHQRGL